MTTLGEIAKRNEDICHMYNAGGKTQKEVAKIFGVSQATVNVALKNYRKKQMKQAEDEKRRNEFIEKYEQLKAYLKRKWGFSEDDILGCTQVANSFGIRDYSDIRLYADAWMESSYPYFDDYLVYHAGYKRGPSAKNDSTEAVFGASLADLVHYHYEHR